MPAPGCDPGHRQQVSPCPPASDQDCGEVLARVNRLFFETYAPHKFATVFYGVYDARTRVLTYANAGHYPPLLVNGGPECIRLHSLTPPVGILPSLPAAQQTIQLADGDWLAIMSDGVPEACDENDEQFGYHRLFQILHQQRNVTAQKFCQSVLDTVATYSRGHKQADDLTLIAASIGSSNSVASETKALDARPQ